jgi:hypothetical protein
MESLENNFALKLLEDSKHYVLHGCSTRLLFREGNNYIFMQEGISHSVRFWGRLAINEKMIFITTLPWHHTFESFSSIANVISTTQPLGASTLNQPLPISHHAEIT